MSPVSPMHPPLLYFVQGQLPEDGMRDAVRHLAICSKCRDDEAALRFTLRSLPSPPGDLEAPVPRSRRAPARGRREEGRVHPRRPARERGAGVLALALLALVFPAAWTIWLDAPAGPGLEPARRVTLMPGQRGIEHEPVVSSGGAWIVRVVLPYGAPEGAYRLRLVQRDAAERPLAEATAISNRGALEVILRAPGATGPLGLKVEAQAPLPAARYDYPFDARTAGS